MFLWQQNSSLHPSFPDPVRLSGAVGELSRGCQTRGRAAGHVGPPKLHQTDCFIHFGVPPPQDGVSMETRVVISCMLMCWKAKSKGGREEAEDGGQQALPGEPQPQRMEERRQGGHFAALTCDPPGAQSMAGSEGWPCKGRCGGSVCVGGGLLGVCSGCGAQHELARMQHHDRAPWQPRELTNKQDSLISRGGAAAAALLVSGLWPGCVQGRDQGRPGQG